MSEAKPPPTPRRFDLVGVVLGALSILFPLIALLLARPLGPLVVVGALIAVIVVRALTGIGKGTPSSMTWAALVAAGTLAAITAIDAHLAMRLYPVLMNATMLAAFAISLVKGPSIMTQFARLIDGDLPESGVRYTRVYTGVWCGFFIVNGLIALWTALYAPLHVWAIYNGAVSYVLMGVLAGGELLVRGPYQRAHHHRDLAAQEQLAERKAP